MSVLPNFLLIGPPKCATSSLHAWLCGHPGVHPGAQKELFFLMDRDHPLKGSPNLHDNGIEAYSRLYPREAAGAAVRIDSTTHYLYQRAALDFARSHSDVRACVVLRDPAERVFSSFSYTKNNLANLASDLTFERFLKLVDQGRPLYPEFCRSPTSAWVLERDIEFSHYKRHLAPWIEALGRGRVEIVFFEDLRDRPREVTQQVLEGLGLRIDLSIADAGEARNVTRPVRFSALHRAAHRFNAAVSVPAGLKSLAVRAYYRLQGAASQAPHESETVDALRGRFANDVKWLEELTGRDLSHWRNGRPGAKSG